MASAQKLAARTRRSDGAATDVEMARCGGRRPQVDPSQLGGPRGTVFKHLNLFMANIVITGRICDLVLRIKVTISFEPILNFCFVEF